MPGYRTSPDRRRAFVSSQVGRFKKARPIRAEKWRASVTRLDRESETRIRIVLYSRGFWRGFWPERVRLVCNRTLAPFLRVAF